MGLDCYRQGGGAFMRVVILGESGDVSGLGGGDGGRGEVMACRVKWKGRGEGG